MKIFSMKKLLETSLNTDLNLMVEGYSGCKVAEPFGQTYRLKFKCIMQSSWNQLYLWDWDWFSNNHLMAEV